MISDLPQPKEKKVEYIELIYDLIFVYIVGRNNSLLHSFSNGFFTSEAFLAYVLTTLAAIQIWNFTTYYINIYGRHGIREHVFLFVNMFLLYFIGEGTRSEWQGFHTQYHIAWALILVNIGIQYLIELRNHSEEKAIRIQILRMAAILFAEALIVAINIPVYQATQRTWFSLFAVLFGMFAVALFGQKYSAGFVDFTHLSERAMLYVVFSFGEMIIVIASYFEGEFSLRNTYFALMAFLIAIGLFLSYGVFYDHIIDREKRTNGLGYMFMHIFIIFAINNISNGLEFMQEESIRLIPKVLFLIVSFLLFFGFLFALGFRHAKAKCSGYRLFFLRTVPLGAAFSVLMVLLREKMLVNIALSTVFVFALFAMIYHYGIRMERV